MNKSSLWIKYLPPSQLPHLLDKLVSTGSIPHLSPIIQPVLCVLRSSMLQDEDILHAISKRIPQLWRIRQQLNASSELEELILAAIESTLPMGISGYGFDLGPCDDPPLSVQMQRASARWRRRSLQLGPDISLVNILDSDPWLSSTAKVVASIAYKNGIDLAMFETWLKSGHSTCRSSEDLLTVIHAALDIYHCAHCMDLLDPTAWIPHLRNIISLVFNHDIPFSVRQRANSCLTLALKAFLSHREDLIHLVIEHVNQNLIYQPTVECVRMGVQLLELSTPILDWALHWLIRYLANSSLMPAQAQRITQETSMYSGQSDQRYC